MADCPKDNHFLASRILASESAGALICERRDAELRQHQRTPDSVECSTRKRQAFEVSPTKLNISTLISTALRTSPPTLASEPVVSHFAVNLASPREEVSFDRPQRAAL
jgi:hypothetical protein